VKGSHALLVVGSIAKWRCLVIFDHSRMVSDFVCGLWPMSHFCRRRGVAARILITRGLAIRKIGNTRLKSWGPAAHGLFILQCSNYLYLVRPNQTKSKSISLS
jgi:hypothetical protein